MSLSVEVPAAVERQMADWGLPNALLLEVYRRLDQDLPRDAATKGLRRVYGPVDDYIWSFAFQDPADPHCQHFFLFTIRYRQDETGLVVTNCGYTRNPALPGPPGLPFDRP